MENSDKIESNEIDKLSDNSKPGESRGRKAYRSKVRNHDDGWVAEEAQRAFSFCRQFRSLSVKGDVPWGQ